MVAQYCASYCTVSGQRGYSVHGVHHHDAGFPFPTCRKKVSPSVENERKKVTTVSSSDFSNIVVMSISHRSSLSIVTSLCFGRACPTGSNNACQIAIHFPVPLGPSFSGTTRHLFFQHEHNLSVRDEANKESTKATTDTDQWITRHREKHFCYERRP